MLSFLLQTMRVLLFFCPQGVNVIIIMCGCALLDLTVTPFVLNDSETVLISTWQAKMQPI